MSKTPEQTVVDTSQDPSLGYIKAREVSNLISSENGIITTQTNKGYVVNTLENVTRVISKVVETNVSADWSAEEGPTAILNKPNLDVYTTQADIDDAIANLVNSAPGALNTLSELANALGNNASYASSITNQLAEKADLTYVNDALANISDISVGNIEFNDTTLSVVGGNLVKDITIVTGDDKQFVFGADGTLTIPDAIQSSVNGIPTFTSATDIILEAVNRVKVQGASFKLASKTNGQRQLLLPQAGDMIYNTTVNAVQVYTGSVWVSLGSGGSGSGLEEGTISDLAVGLGIHILGATPTANTAAGEVLIEGGYDLSESGGPNAKGGTITLAAGQGANDVDAAHGGDIYIYSGPASQYAGNIRIEGGGTYGASGKAGDILLQSGSSLSGVAGNITIQSGVGSFGMQIFEGALKLRGANVDVTSSFESVKIKTGDVDFNDPAGPSVWEFDNVGVMHLPTGDSSIVSTAGNVTISGHDVPANGSGATGAVFIRGGIDYTNNPLTQDRVYINNTYIQGTTLGQEDSTANLNLYSVGGMELTTAGGGMKLEVGPSMFGYGEDMTIVAGNGGDEGAQSSDGGDLILSAGNGGFNAEGQPEARGGNVYLSSGGGLGGAGSVIIEAGPETWTFDNDGSLTVPGSITSPDRLTLNSVGATSEYTAAVLADGNLGRVFVRTLGGTGATLQTWEFNKEGKLMLPAGGDIVDSAGTSVLGGGASTGNITFIGDSIESSNNIVNVSASNFAQLESTDGSNTTQIWTELNNAVVFVNGTSWRFNTPTVAGASSNAFEMPNGITQRSGDHVTCVAGVDTVIYTSALDTNHTIKLLLNIEGVEDGQTDTDTQSCEMIVAKGMRANSVAGSAYGLVYTSTNPLVTLSTRWNAVASRVEITCRPVSLTNQVSVRSTGIEVAASGAG